MARHGIRFPVLFFFLVFIVIFLFEFEKTKMNFSSCNFWLSTVPEKEKYLRVEKNILIYSKTFLKK